MNQSALFCSIACVVCLAIQIDAAWGQTIQFDLPPMAAGRSLSDPQQDEDRRRVEFELRLSSLISRPEIPKVDQWLVICRPRSSDASVVDYYPKTETESDLVSPITVKQTNELSDSFGLSLESSYETLMGADFGIDHSQKETASVSYDKRPQVQAVSAAGTIERGGGVYFKLRWTAVQVLEGEKVFRVTMDVPSTWRGELFDVSVRAHVSESVLGGLDRKTVELGAADFVVAVYRRDDEEAKRHAQQLALAERHLRKQAKAALKQKYKPSIADFFKQVSQKFEDQPKKPWLQRVLAEPMDARLDREIAKLPIDLRTAALDYVDARDEFTRMATHSG